MIFDEDIHFTTRIVVGGYRKVKDGRINLVTVLEEPKHLKDGTLCTHQIKEEGGYKCSEMQGFIMGIFAERFRAAKPGEPFRWKNWRFERLTNEEVHKLIHDGPYKQAMFGL